MWWLWIVVLPTVLVFLLILAVHIEETITKMQHRKLAKILKNNEILRELMKEAEKRGILICLKGGKASKIRMWYAVYSLMSKRIEIPKSSLKEFLRGKTEPIITAMYLAHEMGHLQSPPLPYSYCPLLKRHKSCLYEESRAFIRGFKIMENLGITDWKDDALLDLASTTLQNQCRHCFSDDKKSSPDFCRESKTIKNSIAELTNLFANKKQG